MRLLYDNKIRGAILTPSSENANYPASNLKDPRLSRHLRFTGDEDEWLLVDSGGLLKDIFQATVNLVSYPEDWTQPIWSKINCTVSLSDYYYDGKRFNKLLYAGADPQVYQTIDVSQATVSWSLEVKKGNQASGDLIFLVETGGVGIKTQLSINWVTKTVSVLQGSYHILRWRDSESFYINGIVTMTDHAANDLTIRTDPVDTIGAYVYATAAQVENFPYSTPYVNGFRAAVSPNHAFEMPNMFIFKIKVGPWFPYYLGSDPKFLSWYVDADRTFYVYYANGSDQIAVCWKDGVASQWLVSQQFDDGTNHDDINSKLVLIGAVRLDQQTGQRFFVIVDGVKQAEDTSFDAKPDSKLSTFSTLSIGHMNSVSHAESQFESVQFWAWDGSDLGALSSEAEFDAVMKNKPTIFEQIYQPKIKASYAVLAGHNLSADAIIHLHGNDWNAWNGTPFERTLVWDPDIILKNFTEKEYPYWLFWIDNPNNEDSYIKLGLAYLGTYLTMPAIEPGVEMPRRTASVKTRSGSGQVYGRKNYRYHSFTVVYPPFIDSNERDAIDEMFAQVFNVDPLFVLLWENSLDVFPPLYCMIIEPELPWKKSDEGRYWGLPISFEEVF